MDLGDTSYVALYCLPYSGKLTGLPLDVSERIYLRVDADVDASRTGYKAYSAQVVLPEP